MSLFLFDLAFARGAGPGVSGLTVAGFLAQPGSTRLCIDLVGIGLSAGVFVVPLFALIQSRTPKDELARVIAGMNIQNALLIVLATGLSIGAQQLLGWTLPQLFLALAVVNTLVSLWIFGIVPEFAMRFVSWLLVRSLYRLRVQGIERHVPDEGAALIVCNHVSYMDALILAGSIAISMAFMRTARCRSPWASACSMRVRPQPGQSRPVIERKMQGGNRLPGALGSNRRSSTKPATAARAVAVITTGRAAAVITRPAWPAWPRTAPSCRPTGRWRRRS